MEVIDSTQQNLQPTVTALSDTSLAEAVIPIAPLDSKAITTTLLKMGHMRDLLLMSTIRYVSSRGLWGIQPNEFCQIMDIGPAISKGLIPQLRGDLQDLGVCEGVASPFGVSVGYVPGKRFLEALRSSPDLFPRLLHKERQVLSYIPDDILDSSSLAIEKRFIALLANSFLLVDFCDPLPKRILHKALPDFDGMQDLVSRLLGTLHDRELITLKVSEGENCLYLTPSFYSLVEDQELVNKLKDPLRKAEVIYVADPILIGAASATDSKSENTSAVTTGNDTKIISNSKSPKVSGDTAKGSSSKKTGVHERGEQVRDLILAELRSKGGRSNSQLVNGLGDAGRSLRYHLAQLVKAGEVIIKGSGHRKLFTLVDQKS